MSGNLLFDLLMGDRLPSSGRRYFSLFRRTFETVLGEEDQSLGDSYGDIAIDKPPLNAKHS